METKLKRSLVCFKCLNLECTARTIIVLGILTDCEGQGLLLQCDKCGMVWFVDAIFPLVEKKTSHCPGVG